MRVTDYYMKILQTVCQGQIYLSYQTTNSQLAHVLHLSLRYTKEIIREMQRRGWIFWQPGRGRGNLSSITCLLSQSQLYLQQAKQEIQQGMWEEGITKITQISSIQEREEFMDWFQQYYGIQTEKDQSKSTDVLRYPFYQANQNLDPISLISRHDHHIAEHIFDTLTFYDDVTGAIQPWLAHSWIEEANGQIWTFYLRKGVLFHHGRELNASDIVHTFRRLLQSQDPISQLELKEFILNVKEIHPYAVQFQLSKPNYLFPHVVSHIRTAIIPIECISDCFSIQPVGTGPYRCTKFTEHMMVLEAHTSYFKGRSFLDRVEIITLPLCTHSETLFRFSFILVTSRKQIYGK